MTTPDRPVALDRCVPERGSPLDIGSSIISQTDASTSSTKEKEVKYNPGGHNNRAFRPRVVGSLVDRVAMPTRPQYVNEPHEQDGFGD